MLRNYADTINQVADSCENCMAITSLPVKSTWNQAPITHVSFKMLNMKILQENNSCICNYKIFTV